MKKILRLTGTKNILKNELKFKEAAQKVWNIDIDFLCYLDLFFDIDWNFKNIYTEEKVWKYDFFWIGGIKGIPFKNSLTYYYIHLLKKSLIDQRVASFLDNSKLSQIVLLQHLKIKIPKSMFFVASKENKKIHKELILKRFSYPFILKNPILDRGEGVFLIKNETDLNIHFQTKNYPCYLIQNFIENDGDYRVLTTKEKILWVIKRFNEKDFRNNISAGGISKMVKDIPTEIITISKKILEEYGLDIAGIDFFIKDGSYYVIEINDFPQYAWFEEATGLSYAEEILWYIKQL